MRRIEALTGFGAYLRLEEDENLIAEISHTLRAPRTELTRAITRLLDQQRQLENELADLKRKAARSQIGSLAEAPGQVKGVPVVSQRVEGIDGSIAPGTG